MGEKCGVRAEKSMVPAAMGAIVEERVEAVVTGKSVAG